ncbi:MAG: Mrp/NBP35 family ATP-binding protein [Pirellulales bacterium]|nr:Mrp/NBP35 family ATP-binding protein [Pirellulales bacterium]
MSDVSILRADVERVLADFQDPETGRGIWKLEQVRDLAVGGGRIALTLALTTHAAPLWNETRAELVERLQREFPAADVQVKLATHERPPERLGEIGLAAKSVVAVGSGKGGVGKSTIAASLAYGLRRAGCKVGLMDADVYGPSVPHLIGVNRRPEIVNQKIQPIVVDEVKVMSMGFLVPPGEAVVWRGPMLHGAITQFLRDTDWGELDYLFIDLPPGTGDIALTLSQLLPLTGAVVVCTPQDVALIDAVKAIAMFRKVNIPVLGMVENMSYFVCPNCDKRYDIFGSGGAKRQAAELDVPFLGEVPINIAMRVNGDEGRVGASFDDPTCAPFLEGLCYRLVKEISTRHKQAPPSVPLPIL